MLGTNSPPPSAAEKKAAEAEKQAAEAAKKAKAKESMTILFPLLLALLFSWKK